jgi:glycosyltransferase involved in cell wall biosynthesis
MNSPLVSIVTPSYQAVQYITETIECVINQDYPNLEHIVVDGNSEDGTIEILQGYDHLKWISEPDAGQSQALNKGFKMAKGEIIGWLNADDTYNPGAISCSVNYLIQHPDIDSVYSDLCVVDEHGAPITIFKSKPFSLERMLFRNLIGQSTVFIRKQVIDEIGGVDESLHYCMDREFWFRIGSKYKFKYLPDIVSANFRKHSSTKTYKKPHCFHTEWERVLISSIKDPRYCDIPLKLKLQAIQQAKVRLILVKIKSELNSKNFSNLAPLFFSLVSNHWRYIFRYPIKKIDDLLNP